MFLGDYSEAVGVMLFYRVGEYLQERAVAVSYTHLDVYKRQDAINPVAARQAAGAGFNDGVVDDAGKMCIRDRRTTARATLWGKCSSRPAAVFRIYSLLQSLKGMICVT